MDLHHNTFYGATLFELVPDHPLEFAFGVISVVDCWESLNKDRFAVNFSFVDLPFALANLLFLEKSDRDSLFLQQLSIRLRNTLLRFFLSIIQYIPIPDILSLLISLQSDRFNFPKLFEELLKLLESNLMTQILNVEIAPNFIQLIPWKDIIDHNPVSVNETVVSQFLNILNISTFIESKESKNLGALFDSVIWSFHHNELVLLEMLLDVGVF